MIELLVNNELENIYNISEIVGFISHHLAKI